MLPFPNYQEERDLCRRADKMGLMCGIVSPRLCCKFQTLNVWHLACNQRQQTLHFIYPCSSCIKNPQLHQQDNRCLLIAPELIWGCQALFSKHLTQQGGNFQSSLNQWDWIDGGGRIAQDQEQILIKHWISAFIFFLLFSISIHFPSVCPALRVVGALEPMPALTGKRQRTPWTAWQSVTGRQSLAITATDKLEWPVQLACLWTVGGSQRTQKEPMQAHGECPNSIQKKKAWVRIEPTTFPLWSTALMFQLFFLLKI